MLIDDILMNVNFSSRVVLDSELFSVQVYYQGECIFNVSKIKCCREDLRNLKELYSYKLLEEITKRNLLTLIN